MTHKVLKILQVKQIYPPHMGLAWTNLTGFLYNLFACPEFLEQSCPPKPPSSRCGWCVCDVGNQLTGLRKQVSLSGTSPLGLVTPSPQQTKLHTTATYIHSIEKQSESQEFPLYMRGNPFFKYITVIQHKVKSGKIDPSIVERNTKMGRRGQDLIYFQSISLGTRSEGVS